MTQKHVLISAHIALLVLGVSIAQAEVTKEGHRELLPAPKCCCETVKSSAPACCPSTPSCLAYAKENGEAHARGKLINKVYAVEKLVPPSEPVVLELSGSESLVGWATDTPLGRQLLDEAPQDTLVRLLTENIEPESWRENGGLGSVGYFPPGKALVVSQTEDVHQQVGNLLEKLNGVLHKGASVCASNPLLGLQQCAPAVSSWIASDAPLPTPVTSPMPIFANPMPFQPAGFIMSPSPAIMQCAATQAQDQPSKTWRVRTVVLRGETRLAMQEWDPDSVTVTSLEIQIPGDEPLHLTAAGNQIQAMHPSLQARADTISRMGPAGCFLFEGHVKLISKKQGQHWEVTAERVLVDLAEGRWKIESGIMAGPRDRVKFDFLDGTFR